MDKQYSLSGLNVKDMQKPLEHHTHTDFPFFQKDTDKDKLHHVFNTTKV